MHCLRRLWSPEKMENSSRTAVLKEWPVDLQGVSKTFARIPAARTIYIIMLRLKPFPLFCVCTEGSKRSVE